MKGLTHFTSGVAAATFIPEIVRMSTSTGLPGVEGAASSLILLWAGGFGVLPDTMDFKIGQFFSIAEIEVDPDPNDPDPQMIADAFAEAVKRAGDTGRPVRIQFFTMQLGASLWRQYNVIFAETEVTVQLNEIVRTSQVPIAGTAPPLERRIGRAALAYPLKTRTDEHDWLNRLIRSLRQRLKGPDAPPGPVKPTTLDIFGGTQFELKKEEDGKIFFNWLPWHRTWSHSYVLGFLLSLPVFGLAYALGWANWWLYGLVANVGFITHITEDMTGHIGGALLWPLHKPRSEGFELFKASDPRTNFSVNYTALMIILWNVDRFSTQIIALPWFVFFGLFWAAPMAFYFWFVGNVKKRLALEEKTAVATEDEADGVGDVVVD